MKKVFVKENACASTWKEKKIKIYFIPIDFDTHYFTLDSALEKNIPYIGLRERELDNFLRVLLSFGSIILYTYFRLYGMLCDAKGAYCANKDSTNMEHKKREDDVFLTL